MLESLDYILAFLLIGFAGFVDSIAGGGGLITVPTYMFLGLPPQVLLGTNKLVSTAGASVSIFRYARAGAIDWHKFRLPIFIAFVGSIIGAWLSRYQSKELMLSLLLVVVPAVLTVSLGRPKINLNIHLSSFWRFGLLVLLAAVIGTYDGFFGPGTGSFFLFALLYLFGFAPREASANARILNYASNVGALVYFSSQFKFSIPIALLGVVASLIGNYFGSHFVLNHAAKIVRPLYLLVLFALLSKLLWDWAANA